MSILQLRNHVSVGGVARREPADGTESPMRVSLGFEPAWYHRRLGIDFSLRWHTDPQYRHDTVVAMKRELHRTFPQVPYWDPDDESDTWSISGVYGAYVTAQILGATLRYAPDRWPTPERHSELSLEALADVDPEAVLAGPWMQDLYRQMDIIERASGRIHGYIVEWGILNNAFATRGPAILYDLVDRPDLTRRFFEVICEVVIRLAQRVQQRQRDSGFYSNSLCVSNCTVSMISPRMYREFLFPHDKRIAETFERFGVHTCEWKVDPYLEALHDLPNMGYLDTGLASDLPRVKALFPETRRAVLYPPRKLLHAPLEEIRADLARVYAELAPCDIVLGSVSADTPDARVHALLDLCRELETEGLPAQSAG